MSDCSCAALRWTGRNGGTGASLGIDGFFRLPEDPNDPPEDPTREVITAWHVDGLEWAKETHPPLADMWADWNLGKEPVKGDVMDTKIWRSTGPPQPQKAQQPRSPKLAVGEEGLRGVGGLGATWCAKLL